MVKGNKGEWSEFYAFLKLLTDGKMFGADKNLEILKENFYLVLKIIREEKRGKKSYDISKNDGRTVINDEDGNLLGVVELENIKSKVADIFSAMKNADQTTFRIMLAEKAMQELHCSQIKASSGKKSDLTVILHDKKSPQFPELGFSIKSMLGSPSTLLNASGATNFVYALIENNLKIVADENLKGAQKIRDKTKYVYDAGGRLEFRGLDSVIFRRNLRKIDSNFPQIMAEIVRNYYKGNGHKISDLVDLVSADKQFNEKIDFPKEDYILKVKNFLSAVALGMTPGHDWDGYTQTHGGYIIVKENGDVICYHLYNRDEFEDYLYNNTRLDTPSTGRHKFGEIYEEAGEKMIKYNLQIRFIK